MSPSTSSASTLTRRRKLHESFEDPAAVQGSEEERLAAFRRVRDQMRVYLAGYARKQESLVNESPHCRR
jgi:hypothetical protein